MKSKKFTKKILHLERSEIPMKRSESGTASQSQASVFFSAKCFLWVSADKTVSLIYFKQKKAG